MAIHNKPISIKTAPTVRQLRAFAAVYHSGQLSSAAEALSLTQPAVTVLLRGLEEKLGVRLFDRTTRSLQRTAAAVEAIDYAERVLAELDAMSGSMAELSGARRGRVRIAATSTVAQTILPRVLRHYMDAHPGVKVMIEDCAPGEFVQLINSDRVDFGVGTLEAPTPGLEERVFLRDSLVAAALAPGFAGAATITLKQLSAYPLVTVKAGYGVRRRIELAAATANVNLTIVHEVSLLTTALAMAAGGLGVAVVPGSILAHMPYPDIVSRRLVRPAVQRHTAVVFKRERPLSPAAAAFAALLGKEFGS